jgi:hypothetical protein
VEGKKQKTEKRNKLGGMVWRTSYFSHALPSPPPNSSKPHTPTISFLFLMELGENDVGLPGLFELNF